MTQEQATTAALAPISASPRDILLELRRSPALAASPESMALIARIDEAIAGLAQESVVGKSQITNVAAMRAYIDFGTFVAGGSCTLPDHLKGNPADCTAIAMRAERLGLDFYGLAEKTHVIGGKLGYEGQVIGAILKNMGAIQEPALKDEYFGDWDKILGKFEERESKSKKDNHGYPVKYKVPAWKADDEVGLGIRVWGTLPGETEPRVLEVLMTQALTRNSTLWATNPKQQIFYLAEKLWGRKYAPWALLGVNTVDDLMERAGPRDMGVAEEVPRHSAGGRGGLPQNVLDAWKKAADKGTAAAREFWMKTLTAEQRKAATDEQKNHYWAIAVKVDADRTIDTPPAQAAEPPAPPPAAAAAPAAATSSSAPDPDFVAAMDRAEQAQGGAGE